MIDMLIMLEMYVISLFEGQVPSHNFGLFVCHQDVVGDELADVIRVCFPSLTLVFLIGNHGTS